MYRNERFRSPQQQAYPHRSRGRSPQVRQAIVSPRISPYHSSPAVVIPRAATNQVTDTAAKVSYLQNFCIDRIGTNREDRFSNPPYPRCKSVNEIPIPIKYNRDGIHPDINVCIDLCGVPRICKQTPCATSLRQQFLRKAVYPSLDFVGSKFVVKNPYSGCVCWLP